MRAGEFSAYTLAMWSCTAWVTSLTCSGLFQIWSNSCKYCSVIGASSSRFTKLDTALPRS